MLSTAVDEQSGVAIIEPNGALTAKDFASATEVIDPWIERYGKLKGLIIRTPGFPGWESLGAAISHLAFVKDHHRNISRVALVTDSAFGEFGEKLANHFVSAEIKHFRYSAMEDAIAWVSNAQ